MIMESPSPIFTSSFDYCIEKFFSESAHEVLGEVMCLIRRTSDLPEPTECGLHKIRTKQLLPATNTIIYYWDYGRVWEFFGVVSNGNDEQLDELDKLLVKIENE